MGKIHSYDDTKPTLLSIPVFDILPFRSPSDFFYQFGDATIEISDVNGTVVENSQLNTLVKWWEDRSSVPKEEVLRGHVVHWPIHKDSCSSPLQDVINYVTEELVMSSPDLRCIFDHYDFEQIPRFAWTIIGPKAVPIRAHQDMFGTASWNLLFSGRKEWFFWNPELLSVEGSSPSYSFVQNPGELIWIPENWWHSVIYNDASICFSKNLVLRRSVDNVLASMKEYAPKYAHVLKAILQTEQKRKPYFV